jgi:hypothetical protein
MDMQRSAELQVLLEGVDLPAKRQELVDYAVRQDEGERFLGDLDEVGEQLIQVQPSSSQQRLQVPRDESGQPPGGDAYTDPNAEPGAVREDWPEGNPPEKALEKQTETQKTQQQRQQEGG